MSAQTLRHHEDRCAGLCIGELRRDGPIAACLDRLEELLAGDRLGEARRAGISENVARGIVDAKARAGRQRRRCGVEPGLVDFADVRRRRRHCGNLAKHRMRAAHRPARFFGHNIGRRLGLGSRLFERRRVPLHAQQGKDREHDDREPAGDGNDRLGRPPAATRQQRFGRFRRHYHHPGRSAFAHHAFPSAASRLPTMLSSTFSWYGFPRNCAPFGNSPERTPTFPEMTISLTGGQWPRI